MKRLFQTFIIFTIGILLISGFYIWISNKDDVMTLSHVSDPDWSKEYQVTPKLITDKFAFTLTQDEQIHTIWPEYLQPRGEVVLKYIKSNSEGKLLTEAKKLAQTKFLQCMTLISHKETLHFFWIGSNQNEGWNLNYTQMDQAGSVIKTETIMENGFTKVNGLQVIPTFNDEFMLVWTDLVNNINQVYSMVVTTSGQRKAEPMQITSLKEKNAVVPQLALDEKNRFHLTWQKRGKSSLNYQLFYQRLDEKGHPSTPPLYIDRVSVDHASMVIKGDKLILVWTKTMDYVKYPLELVERSFPNYEIFGTTIDLSDPTNYEIQRLTHKNGPSFQHVINVDDQGQVHILYVELYDMHLAFTHGIYKDDFKDKIKEFRRIYPNQTITSTPTLITDTHKNMHIFWKKSDLFSTSLSYANTAKPHPVTLFNIIGLNSEHFLAGIVMSLFYVLAFPLVGSIVSLYIIYVLILTPTLAGVRKLLKDPKVASFLRNPYFAVSFICGLYLFFHLVIFQLKLFCFHEITLSQIWFVFILATTAIIAFITVTKMKGNNVIQVGFTAFFWFFWIQVIYCMFNLPFINHLYIDLLS